MPNFFSSPIWETSDEFIAYPQAVEKMESCVEGIFQGQRERIWLLEHPPLYTCGPRAQSQDLLDAHRFPVYSSARGGQYTYHGPGQRVGYVMINLKKRRPDLKWYIHEMEQWLITCLKEMGVRAHRHQDHVGVWVTHPLIGLAKIASIGIRVRKWVTYHGFALNVCPDLSHFNAIVPCGIKNSPMTSLKEMGVTISLGDLDHILCQNFNQFFLPPQ